MNSPVDPEQYTLGSVIVTADRWKDYNEAGYELSQVTMELQIFESLENPYLTAKIIILDNVGLLDAMNFQGTERWTIKLQTSDNATPIIKHFMTHKILSSVKSNDTNETISFRLVEERFYQSQVTSLNRTFKKIIGHKGSETTFKSSITNVIESILTTLDRKSSANNYLLSNELLHDKTNPPYFDGNLKLNIPNMSPLQAVKWLCDRCISATGLPYFIFASMGDDRIRFLDLESMLTGPAINDTLMPYTHSYTLATHGQTITDERKSFLILASELVSGENQMEYSAHGLGPCSYNFIDTYTGQTQRIDHDPEDMFQHLFDVNIFDRSKDTVVYDPNLTFDGRRIGNFMSNTYTSITTSKTMSSTETDDGNRGYDEMVEPRAHQTKITARCLRNYLKKSSLKITVPGRNFIAKNANLSIGNKINVLYNRGQHLGPEVSEGQKIDIKKSGHWLVYEAAHTFAKGDTGFTTSLLLTKLATERR